MTDTPTLARTLIVAPHPDDDAIGAGGLIQRAVASGARVRVVFATDGESNAWPQRFTHKKLVIRKDERARWGAMRREEALEALALEIGSRSVTVNAVAPGFVATAMTDVMTQEARETLEGRIALRRLGTVDDVAYATVFLASEQAGYITGTVLNVSGGLYT